MDEDSQLIQKIIAKTPYRCLSKLGEGAYGEVYKVVHRDTKQPSALKVIDLPKINKLNKMTEVMIEINILKRHVHPGMIKLKELLRWQGFMGLVLEFGPHGDLFRLIKLVNKKKEFANRRLKIMKYYLAQILQTLDYIHSSGIVHRDIKPQNFVLGPDLKLRLIDYGTAIITPEAKAFSPEQIQEILCAAEAHTNDYNQLVGSVNYLSPESLKLQYSAKCDIWAFGVLIYKFYYDCLPFQGDNHAQIFQKIVESDIVIDKADPLLQELLVICLKKNPEERATAKMLKMCSFFKDLDFKQVFQLQPPIFKQELFIEAPQQSQFLFQLTVQKKMFFGNFKPRILTLQKVGPIIKMAYRYIPTKQAKRELDLSLNDYAIAIKDEQFEVVLGKKKYFFRVLKGQSAEQVVLMINSIIRKTYQLQ